MPPPSDFVPHAVSRLRTERLARSTRPFLARGGPKGTRCEGCRLRPSHCICALRPQLPTNCGFCLIMHDAEPMKPSNTGWLIADVVQETYAFSWNRLSPNPALLDLINNPQWQPLVVFPGEYAATTQEVITTLPVSLGSGRSPRPLFILLDATWSEARKMFRKSPYLNTFPVLSLQSDQISRYQLRRSQRGDHFCTSEVAALCLELSCSPCDQYASQVLERYLDVFTHHYLRAKQQKSAQLDGTAHCALRQTLQQDNNKPTVSADAARQLVKLAS